MERCKVCDEKSAEIEFCPHCEKRICTECKQTHIDLVKRDLGRLINQVKRIATRISEAHEHMKRGLESIKTNVDSVKEEIQDYVKRYIKELKKREDILLTEIDTFFQAEHRQLQDLKDNLELESTNIAESMEKVDACIKGDKQLTDDEIVRYKHIFLDGIEYLRLFNPESEDYAIKKVRFAVGPDPMMLPHAIGQFGELIICSTHFNKYQAEQYVPKFNLGLESENYPQKRRSWDPSDAKSWMAAFDDEYGSGSQGGSSSRSKPSERLSRQKEESYSRYTTRRSQQESTGSTGSPRRETTSSRQFGQASPWARVQQILDSPAATGAPVVERSPQPQSDDSPTNMTIRRRRDQLDLSDSDDDLNQRVNSIRREYERRQRENNQTTTNRPAPRAQSPEPAVETAREHPSIFAEPGTDDEQEHHPIAITHYPPSPTSSRSPVPLSPPVQESDAPEAPVRQTWRKYLLPDVESAPSDSTKERRSASRDRAPVPAVAPAPAPVPSTPQDDDDDWLDRRQRFRRSRTNPDLANSTEEKDENPAAPTAADNRRHKYSSRADSNSFEQTESGGQTPAAPAFEDPQMQQAPAARPRSSRYRRKEARSHSSYLTTEPDENGNPGRIEMSYSNPDGSHRYYRVITQPKYNYSDKGRVLLKFGCKGSYNGQFNWPRGVACIPTTDEICICDSSNHRVQIFDHKGQFIRSFGCYGSGNGEFDCLAGICVSKYKQFVVTDRYNHRVQLFDSNGRFLREFGSHGQTNGRFSSPWGVVVDQQGFIYVCDKDNHRVQIFQADGNYVGKFGTLGNREGQFQNPHFIACNKQNQLIVTDSSNHRVQVFDHNGHFLFAFGTEGFHEGQFKYPRGVAVDEQGFIAVADSGNNRIQMFYPDGRFYSAFGTWGTGEGQLKQVEGVAITDDGKVVVTDRENHRVQIF